MLFALTLIRWPLVSMTLAVFDVALSGGAVAVAADFVDIVVAPVVFSSFVAAVVAIIFAFLSVASFFAVVSVSIAVFVENAAIGPFDLVQRH